MSIVPGAKVPVHIVSIQNVPVKDSPMTPALVQGLLKDTIPAFPVTPSS